MQLDTKFYLNNNIQKIWIKEFSFFYFWSNMKSILKLKHYLIRLYFRIIILFIWVKYFVSIMYLPSQVSEIFVMFIMFVTVVYLSNIFCDIVWTLSVLFFLLTVIWDHNFLAVSCFHLGKGFSFPVLILLIRFLSTQIFWIKK